MKPVLVSACLLGVNCKYSGGNNLCPQILALAQKYPLVPVCPEQLGGLPTPRFPSERVGETVQNNVGEDVTQVFQRGAQEALKIGMLYGCDTAILKTNSPSCGHGVIYDGTFSGQKIQGEGLTAQLLLDAGYTLYSEENLPTSNA